MAQQSSRLLSLDVLRGITIAGMIMVNNPGSWSYVYTPLGHAQWNGLTPTDLVFPFFMFIMGISTYISLRKFGFKPDKKTIFKIIKRTVVIFAIGLGLGWLSLSFRTFNNLGDAALSGLERFLQAISNFENLRILGVMQRLAITYCITSLVAIFVKHKYIPVIIVAALVAYAILLFVGNGFDFSEDNIISRIDRSVLGVSHMYKDSGIAMDPEGLISSISAATHVLIGFCCGQVLLTIKHNRNCTLQLFIIGTIMMFSGFLLAYGCPINKKIWSPTFVITTCGLACTLLALLVWIVDVKGYKSWSIFFESFGVNPLFVYVLAGVLSVLLTNIGFMYNGAMISIKNIVYQIVLQPLFGDYPGSLLYALLFLAIIWLVGNILYKKKIYIKI